MMLSRLTAVGNGGFGIFSPVTGGLLFVLILQPVSSGVMYVKTASEITKCNMKCPEPLGILELYRICRGLEETLLELHCDTLYVKNDAGLHLNSSSGCWSLSRARKSDSCVYNAHYYGRSEYLLSSTDICVLDPVLITNITRNSTRLGEDIAVSIHYFGEESTVSWELEVESFPERYRLIDDNRTLIIPSVQREDAQRTFRVIVTNPISEETREYRLIDDSNFLRMLKEEDWLQRNRGLVVGIVVGVVIVAVIATVIYRFHRKREEQRGGDRPDSSGLTCVI